MKTTVLELLEAAYQSYVSGEEIAHALKMSRANIWKEIQKLKAKGYQIDAVRNKGYALMSRGNILNEARLKSLLGTLDHIEVHETLASTNTYAKEFMNQHPTIQTALIIANEQSAGKGRMGRNFFSPKNDGIYMSLGFRTDLPLLDSQLITIAAALAVRQVIARSFGLEPSIKWLNDLYLNTHKICGILTEGDINLETASYNYLVVGIGLNLFQTTNLPKDLTAIYGSITRHDDNIDRNLVIAAITQTFLETLVSLPNDKLIPEYKKYSNTIGKSVTIVGQDKVYQAIDIDERGYLVLADENGLITTHHSGEISIRGTL